MIHQKKIKHKKSEKGHALIELIIFLPIFFGIYSFVSGYANAIFTSINQQKIVRSYFYFRVQNSSMFPVPITIDGAYQNWNYFGFFFIGWMDYDYQNFPIMICHKPDLFFSKTDEKCHESYNKSSTSWIKVGSVYGVCGASYFQREGKVFLIPDHKSIPINLISDQRSCLIQ